MSDCLRCCDPCSLNIFLLSNSLFLLSAAGRADVYCFIILLLQIIRDSSVHIYIIRIAWQCEHIHSPWVQRAAEHSGCGRTDLFISPVDESIWFFCLSDAPGCHPTSWRNGEISVSVEINIWTKGVTVALFCLALPLTACQFNVQ